MMLFVDTSVWSLALRRDTRVQEAEVLILRQALNIPFAVASAGKKRFQPF